MIKMHKTIIIISLICIIMFSVEAIPFLPTLTDVQGNKITLSKFLGEKFILLYFFDPTFPLCVQVLSKLEKLSSPQIVIYAIDIYPQTSKNAKEIAPATTIPILIDTKGELARTYKVEDIVPTYCLLDKNGDIAFFKQGGGEEAVLDIKNLIEPATPTSIATPPGVSLPTPIPTATPTLTPTATPTIIGKIEEVVVIPKEEGNIYYFPQLDFSIYLPLAWTMTKVDITQRLIPSAINVVALKNGNKILEINYFSPTTLSELFGEEAFFPTELSQFVQQKLEEKGAEFILTPRNEKLGLVDGVRTKGWIPRLAKRKLFFDQFYFLLPEKSGLIQMFLHIDTPQFIVKGEGTLLNIMNSFRWGKGE